MKSRVRFIGIVLGVLVIAASGFVIGAAHQDRVNAEFFHGVIKEKEREANRMALYKAALYSRGVLHETDSDYGEAVCWLHADLRSGLDAMRKDSGSFPILLRHGGQDEVFEDLVKRLEQKMDEQGLFPEVQRVKRSTELMDE